MEGDGRGLSGIIILPLTSPSQPLLNHDETTGVERDGEEVTDYGFKKLVVWSNARELRKMVYDVTADLPRAEMRRVSQMRDAARSVKQNIQEGYMNGSTAVYVRALNISRG